MNRPAKWNYVRISPKGELVVKRFYSRDRARAARRNDQRRHKGFEFTSVSRVLAG